MKDFFCVQLCKLFLSIRLRKLELLGTSEFFLINATNADFIA